MAKIRDTFRENLDSVVYALKHNELTSLSLPDCGLRDLEAQELAIAVARCSTLEKLNLANNRMTVAGAQLLIDVFDRHESLEEMDLRPLFPEIFKKGEKQAAKKIVSDAIAQSKIHSPRLFQSREIDRIADEIADSTTRKSKIENFSVLPRPRPITISRSNFFLGKVQVAEEESQSQISVPTPTTPSPQSS